MGDQGAVSWVRRKEATKPWLSFPPVFKNFRRAFSPEPIDCSWVSMFFGLFQALSFVSFETTIIQRRKKNLLFANIYRPLYMPELAKTAW